MGSLGDEGWSRHPHDTQSSESSYRIDTVYLLCVGAGYSFVYKNIYYTEAELGK